MTRKECLAALGLDEGANMEEIKRAYRKLAFSLHPDLNPDVPDAAKRFQHLNEAYVLLNKPDAFSSAHTFRSASRAKARASAEEASARAREEAKKAYSKARQGQKDFSYSASQQSQDEGNKEEVLKDILNDPFARRVFQDIYSHIREERRQRRQSAEAAADQAAAEAAGKTRFVGPDAYDWSGPDSGSRDDSANIGKKLYSKVKSWLRKQIDDAQVLRLPGESLVPGARVRLQVQHGLGGETQIIELTLPPEFVPGKTMRLKGLGKRVGGWRGDLYVRIEAV